MIFNKMNTLFLKLGLMIFLLPATLLGQKNLHLSDDVIFPYLLDNDTLGSDLHTAIRPFQENLSQKSKYSFEEKKGLDKIEIDLNFKNKKRPDFINVSLSPIFTGMGGIDVGNITKGIYDVGMGLSFSLRVGDKLYANWNLIDQYTQFNPITQAYIEQKQIVPGAGNASIYRNNQGLYSYGRNNGYISYSPSKYFNFQLGRGKNFIGEGYRSLILSDVANFYDYLKVTTSFWKVKYVNLFSRMKDFSGNYELPGSGRDKYTSMHYLSWNVSKRLNVGLFEAIVWQSEDSLTQRGFDIYYLNPIIFYRPVEFSLGSPDNALIGASASFKLSRSIKFYGQLMLDEFLLKEIRASRGWWANKQAAQLGMRYYNAFKIKGLMLNGEFNYIRPFTYSHALISQNYGHSKSSLAHPLGANLREVILGAHYCKKDWYLETRISYVEKGLNKMPDLNEGGDIFRPVTDVSNIREFGNRTGQGLLTKMIFARLKVSRRIARRNNLRLQLEIQHYSASNSRASNNNTFFQVGIKSNMFNDYHWGTPE